MPGAPAPDQAQAIAYEEGRSLQVSLSRPQMAREKSSSSGLRPPSPIASQRARRKCREQLPLAQYPYAIALTSGGRQDHDLGAELDALIEMDDIDIDQADAAGGGLCR